MSYRFARIATAISLIAGVILVPQVPAGATMSGEVVFECHAYFASYPSSSGSGTCHEGILPAVAQVTAAGSGSNGAYLVDGLGAVSANFTHSEGCIADEPPVVWSMQGTLTISGITALHGGQPATATLTLSFTATIIGADVTFITSGHTLTFSNGGTAQGTTGGAGTGSYFPLIGQDNFCPDGGPMQGLIQGEIDLPI